MSGSDFTVRETCRLCGSGITKVLDLGETALANEYATSQDEPQDTFPLFLSECDDCKHVQLPVVVSPERLFRSYSYVSGTSPLMRAHLAEQARELAVLARGGLVVEIASNDGTLLQEFKRLGLKVLGIDPATNLATEANKRGIPTIAEFLDFKTAHALRKEHGHAGLVVANNVMAHVDDLSAFVYSAMHLLNSDGTLVFEVGYWPDVLKAGLFDTIYHEHLSYHSLLPLVTFFRKRNLFLYDAHRVASQGGSIRAFVSKVPRKASKRLLDLTNAELLLDPRSLGAKMQRTRDALSTALTSMPVGYGAPAKLTTLMASFGMDRRHVRVVLDDNPLKIGKYTPGTHIPILAPQKCPDPILLFSWNFADEIVPRLRSQGFTGPIVVPLPEVRVL